MITPDSTIGSPSYSERLRKAGVWIITRAFDPVVFVTFLAPLTIGYALSFAAGRFAIYSRESDLLTLLLRPEVAGIVDYVLQFYTALLGWTLLMFRAVKEYHSYFDGGTSPDGKALTFIISSVMIFFVGLWVFFLGGGAEKEMLEAYASQGYQLGSVHWPLFTRFLMLRIAVTVLGATMPTSKKS